MKTLDEVIKALETDPVPMAFTDRLAVHEDIMTDALHHLNKYRMTLDDIVAKRKALEDEIARYQEAVKNCKEAENKYRKAEQDALKALDDWASRPVEENKKLVLTVANPPLTWQELRTMEGKPLWVERKRKKAWGLIDGMYTDAFYYDFVTIKVLHDLWHLSKVSMGKTWQAYRKERTDERS